MDRIGLIASDMDFTLLDENGQLPPGFEEMVLALEKQGILFAAASGRPLYTLTAMFPTLLDHMALVADNGGVVVLQGRRVCQSLLEPGGWRQIARYAREQGDLAVLCGLETAYVERQFEGYDRVLKQFYTRVEYVEDLLAVKAEADKFTLYFPSEQAQQACERRYAPAFGKQYAVVVAGSRWVDITNRGVNKGSALRKLGQLRGVPVGGMMAFGDAPNDAEMLRTAKYGFLMVNGDPSLRAKVPFLAPAHWDQGVMKILRRVLEQGGEVSPADFVAAH